MCIAHLKTEKNPTAQRLITAMEKPPHLTHEDVEALYQSIAEGKIRIKFDSPFGMDKRKRQLYSFLEDCKC